MQVPFKHILIHVASFMDTRNATRILYKTPILNEKIGVLQLYKHLIHCAILFPVFLKFFDECKISDQ